MINSISARSLYNVAINNTINSPKPLIRIVATVVLYEAAKILCARVYNIVTPYFERLKNYITAKKQLIDFSMINCAQCHIDHARHILKINQNNCLTAPEHAKVQKPPFDEEDSKKKLSS